MRTSQSSTLDWWYDRLYFEREKRNLAHQERLMSVDIMSTYNKPQAVINLQNLHDNVYALYGLHPDGTKMTLEEVTAWQLARSVSRGVTTMRGAVSYEEAPQTTGQA